MQRLTTEPWRNHAPVTEDGRSVPWYSDRGARFAFLSRRAETHDLAEDIFRAGRHQLPRVQRRCPLYGKSARTGSLPGVSGMARESHLRVGRRTSSDALLKCWEAARPGQTVSAVAGNARQAQGSVPTPSSAIGSRRETEDYPRTIGGHRPHGRMQGRACPDGAFQVLARSRSLVTTVVTRPRRTENRQSGRGFRRTTWSPPLRQVWISPPGSGSVGFDASPPGSVLGERQRRGFMRTASAGPDERGGGVAAVHQPRPS